MTSFHVHRGSVLVMVLIVTAVGLLFGAGSLLLFRYQCQMRIDRQHELEKVYAVRSALNYSLMSSDIDPVDGRSFGYLTRSGRNLGILVKPVEPVFPNFSNVHHLYMEHGNTERRFSVNGGSQYNEDLDYEYGAEDLTGDKGAPTDGSKLKIEDSYDEKYGIAFSDLSETNQTAKWWINIGMRGTGGWLQEDYGRRYSFLPLHHVGDGAVATGDVMRLCIIRNVTNLSNRVGRRHGWPLSMPGERALVFELFTINGDGNSSAASDEDRPNAVMRLSEYEYRGQSAVVVTNHIVQGNCPSVCPMGLQLAGNRMSIFYVSNKSTAALEERDDLRGHTFIPANESCIMTEETYDYFRRGIFTNAYGKVEAPELRAVFEVQATASVRRNGGAVDMKPDFLTKFRVTPAYQFDVFLEHPTTITNRATVAQKLGEYGRDGNCYTMLTYDTHGTENKGFRKDEREAERKRNGQ